MPTLTADERHFLLRRLHSLTGIVPLGGFLLFHFFENAAARRGPAAFNETVAEISKMPYLYALEIALLILPLVFHSVYGLFITRSARPNVGNYPYERNWAYFFQRMSGMIAFFYIGYHIVTTRGWALFVKKENITFADMATNLSQPLHLLIYLVGIAAVTYHFANGIWSFSITWGLVRSEKAQQRLAYATNALFLVLCAVGFDIVSAFVMEKSVFSQLGSLLFG